MTKQILYTIFIALIFVSCSSDGSINYIAESTLTGKVFGENFTAVNGYAEHTEGVFVKVVLTSNTVNCHANMESVPLYLTVAVPDRIGYHQNVMAIFGKSGNEPVTEFDALVEIVKIDDDQLIARIRSENTSENNVEGTFTIPVCGF